MSRYPVGRYIDYTTRTLSNNKNENGFIIIVLTRNDDGGWGI